MSRNPRFPVNINKWVVRDATRDDSLVTAELGAFLTAAMGIGSSRGVGFLRGFGSVMCVVLALQGGCASDLPVVPGETSGGETEGGLDAPYTATMGPLDTGMDQTNDTAGPLDTGTDETDDTGIEPGCGNGIVEAGETCDEQGPSATCDEDCTPVACGDGVLNTTAGEDCDDGGKSAACDVDCTSAICGDGVFNEFAGEECDDATRTGGCDEDCTLVECGDGVMNATAGEACDGAGESITCNADCTPVACGDGITNVTAGEDCDDAGASAGCDEDCTVAECGDGVFNVLAGEFCETNELVGGTCEGLGFGVGTLACDGGCQGYDTNGCTPGMPVLNLSFSQVKRFDFSWMAVQGAEYYQVLESPALGEPYGQLGGDIIGESVSFEMPLHFRWQASYVLRACNAAGCTDSTAVDVVGSLAEAVGYVKASNTEADDWFGVSVALSGDGDTLAVAAYLEESNATGIGGDQTNNGASGSGAVYVFVRDGVGAWSQQAYVKASNTAAGNLFGYGLALSGDGSTLAVSARSERSNATGIGGNQADDSAPDSGAVYVFVRDGAGAWSQQAYVKASNTGTADYFGWSVALSGDGNTLAVGARWEDSNATGIGGNQANNSAVDSGAVYVFVRNGAGVWSQQAYVKASNTEADDWFGVSVALSGDGNTLAVGAYREDSSATGIEGDQADNSALNAGAVYVFVRNGAGVWSQQAYVKASNTEAVDTFSASVALSGDGNILAVSAIYEDSNATGIGGNQANNGAPDSGAVYVFARDGTGAWSQQAYVKASNTGAGDYFGWSVPLSEDGNTLSVGAYWEDSNATGIGGNQADDTANASGAVYMFVRDEAGIWSQQAYVKASNTGANDDFGWSIALSGDGNTLAVGAFLEDSNATGIGGNQADNSATNSGAVYLY